MENPNYSYYTLNGKTYKQNFSSDLVIPNSEFNYDTFELSNTGRISKKRTQSLFKAQKQAEIEANTLLEKLNNQINSKHRSIPFKYFIIIYSIVISFLLIFYLSFQFNLSQSEYDISKLNKELAVYTSENNQLIQAAKRKLDETNILSIASKDLKMIPSDSVKPEYITIETNSPLSRTLK